MYKGLRILFSDFGFKKKKPELLHEICWYISKYQFYYFSTIL